MNGFCNKGFAGCPGRVPLGASGHCKLHRIYAYMKSKFEAERGQGPENIWIKAEENVKKSNLAKELSHNVLNSQCRKECCSMDWLPSQQVAN